MGESVLPPAFSEQPAETPSTVPAAISAVPTGTEGPHQDIVHSSLESSSQRVTPQDVEQARAEKRAAFTKLLDDMEASVDTQGQYFVKLGQKRPITETRSVTTSRFLGLSKTTKDEEQTVGYDDDRALILKASIKREVHGSPREDFIVITPDDVYIIPFYHNDIDNPNGDAAKSQRRDYDTMVALTTGKQTPDDASKYVKTGDWRGAVIKISSRFGADIQLREPGTESFSEDMRRAVEESISRTESPYKKHVEEAKRQQAVATDTAAMIRSLPSRE